MFVTLFSVTVKSRDSKLATHLDGGWMYGVYQNHDAAVYLFLYFHFALSSMFRLQMTIFITLFSVTMKPKELKLGTQLDMGYCIKYTEIMMLLLIHSFLSPFFSLFNFQTSDENFCHTFLSNHEA